MTEALWGAGSTAPYMHDGRATTIAEAIIEHGNGSSSDTSEGRFARSAYLNRSTGDKRALIAFVENLVLFKMEEEEGAAASSGMLGLLQAPAAPRQVVKIAPKGFRIVVQ
jgi:hypothetical protein